MRPSAILDIVRSGEAFADMVPEEIRGSSCAGGGGKTTTKTTIDVAAEKRAEEAADGGCAKGTTGDPSQGGEMSQFERQLGENERAAHLETEITLPAPTQTPAPPLPIQKRRKGKSGRERKDLVPKTKKQQLGSCRRCGYMSSQELCKACVILDDLNKNRPRIEIELDDEDEDASSSVRRNMEALDLRKSMTAGGATV